MKIQTYKKGNNILTIIGNLHVMPERKWEEVEEVFANCDLILCEGVLKDRKEFLQSFEPYNFEIESSLHKFYSIIADVIDGKTQRWFYDRVCEDTRYVKCDIVATKLDDLTNIENQLEEKLPKIKTTFKKYKLILKPLIKLFLYFVEYLCCLKTDKEFLIDTRNQIVLDTFPILFQNYKHIGILYGKGHLKDFHDRLIKDGFTKERLPVTNEH
jgi:hypothetical protein